MNKKSDRRPRVFFSAAKFKGLPMPEKLTYLREAFSAIGNGLQVLERRHAPPRNPPPIDARVERNRLFGAKGAPRPTPGGGMLSRSQFERLTLENKLRYLATAYRQLRRASARRNGALAGGREPGPPPKPVVK
jgi:hypothetical protein